LSFAEVIFLIKGGYMNINELTAFDSKYIWHPCTQMKDHEDFPIIPIVKGEGAYIFDANGTKILDAISSWWVNIFGHCNKRINNAIKEQLEKIEHVIFAGFTHEPAIELSKNIIRLMPDNITKIFFADNGSSAVEVALKMSFQYWQQTGKTKKTKFAAIDGAYHGETIGALSVGGIDLYKKIYNPILLETYFAKGPTCFTCPFHKNRETCNAECFSYIEEIINLHHEELAAIIIEPMVQCANSMNIYSKNYLKKLYNKCKEKDILLIADEIAVGFGRTGKMFAFEHANIKPDIICLSKGLTGGYLPLSLVLTGDDIYNAFYDDYTKLKAFLHSHSYTGNPIACAAAVETLKIFKEEKILIKNIEKSEKIYNKLNKAFLNHPNIGEIRQLGMIAAIEIVKDKISRERFPWENRVGFQIYKKALEYGVLLRPLGDTIYFMPPYVIGEKEIELMVTVAKKSINEVLGQ
jgi:adenosylmethionine-8-amino-7-oxononanoate aminotransferase